MGISFSNKMEIKLSPNYLFQTLQKWELNLNNIIYNLNYIYIYILLVAAVGLNKQIENGVVIESNQQNLSHQKSHFIYIRAFISTSSDF